MFNRLFCDHAIYIMAAFGFSTLVLLLNLWLPLRRYRQLMKHMRVRFNESSS